MSLWLLADVLPAHKARPIYEKGPVKGLTVEAAESSKDGEVRVRKQGERQLLSPPGDSKFFGRFFHACLAGGVYLAPSAYEAGFLSTAHDGPVIARACEVLTTAVREL